MPTVFLSYARADGDDAATRLRAELERAGVTVWRDIEKMQGGLEWKEQLRDVLRSIDAALVLLTPAAIASPVVRWEWESALTLQKRVIPLLIAPCDIPEELKRLHHHDLSQPKRYKKHSMALMALMSDLNGPSKTMTAQPGAGTTQNMPPGSYQPGWKVNGDVIQPEGDAIKVEGDAHFGGRRRSRKNT